MATSRGMELSDWLLVVGAVILGQFALLVIEILRSWLERNRTREERQREFQRKSLIELQEAMDLLATRTGEVVLGFENHFATAEMIERQRLAEARLSLLAPRVDSAAARGYADRYMVSTRGTVDPFDDQENRRKALNA